MLPMLKFHMLGSNGHDIWKKEKILAKEVKEIKQWVEDDAETLKFLNLQENIIVFGIR